MEDAPFVDLEAETTVNAGILRHGRDAFVDCEGLVAAGDLSLEVNQLVFRCAEAHFGDGTERPLDYPTLVSTAKRLRLAEALDDPDAKRHVRNLYAYPVELESVRPHASKILKLAVGKKLDARLADARKGLRRITGDEALNEILGLAENPVFEFVSHLNGENRETKQIGEGVEEWLENVISNPTDNIGIPSPFPVYNLQTGGAFRRGGIAMVAARPGQGKSTWLDNTALHVAGELHVPVFNVDTEMDEEGHWGRILSHLTGVPSDLIVRGQMTSGQAAKVRKKAKWLTTIPYYYRSVIDETFEEQVAAMRRWVVKTVGTDDDGRRKDCLVLYDYLQMTDPREFSGGKFAEYQILGFQMVALARMAKRYDVPVLSMLQLSREGMAAGSDRILWKCDSMAYLFRKTPEEIAADGEAEGNAKIVVEKSRYGPGSAKGDYINIKFDLATSKMTEGKTRFELDKGKKTSKEKGFPSEHGPDEDGFDFDSPAGPEYKWEGAGEAPF